MAAGTYGKQLLEGGGGLEGLSWWQVSTPAVAVVCLQAPSACVGVTGSGWREWGE